MPRPKKTTAKDLKKRIENRIQEYLKIYELDDLNKANDYTALSQMVSYEVQLEGIDEAISKLDVEDKEYARTIKNLQMAKRDATQSFLSFQEKLGVDRRKRKGEDEETPLTYVEWLRESAPKFINKLLKILYCPECNIDLAKFYVYVTENTTKGSIKASVEGVRKLNYNFEAECPQCGSLVKASEVEDSNLRKDIR